MKPLAALIINPVSGSFSDKKMAGAVKLLEQNYRVTLFYTKKRGDAEEFSRELIKDKPALIGVVGGDGTFNEVINSTACSDIPLAFIPTGTSNVLAKEFSIPEDIQKATERMLSGRARDLHLGLINNSRYFALMAGIGFDGEAVYKVNSKIKRLIGKGAYIISGFQVMVNYSPERLKIIIDEKEYEGYGLIVCNARKYAGPFSVCPDADMSAPHLCVFIMHGRGRIDVLKTVLGIIRGNSLKLDNITYTKGLKISVTGEAHIQIDGDYFGKTPAEITLKEHALKLIF